jgi:hypothetical protein
MKQTQTEQIKDDDDVNNNDNNNNNSNNPLIKVLETKA